MTTKTAGPKKKKDEFIPNIVAFACNWCSYAGADTAGVNRVQYSPHFRVVRTMCSGRVTPGFVLNAFRLGADGVLVSGCHFGDCHYIFGNYKAVDQFETIKSLVSTLGLEAGRIRLEWVSAAEGNRPKRTGVTSLTFASVHWAARMVATRSWNAESKFR